MVGTPWYMLPPYKNSFSNRKISNGLEKLFFNFACIDIFNINFSAQAASTMVDLQCCKCWQGYGCQQHRSLLFCVFALHHVDSCSYRNCCQ